MPPASPRVPTHWIHMHALRIAVLAFGENETDSHQQRNARSTTCRHRDSTEALRLEALLQPHWQGHAAIEKRRKDHVDVGHRIPRWPACEKGSHLESAMDAVQIVEQDHTAR